MQVFANDLVMQLTGDPDTLVSESVFTFRIVGDTMYKTHDYKTLDLEALLADQGIRYESKQEEAVNYRCPDDGSMPAASGTQPAQPEAPRAADVPASVFLQCSDTVECSDRDEVVSKMRDAWLTLDASPNRMAQAYADPCLDALIRLDDLHPAIPFEAGIVQPQMDACNAGLREIGQD